MTFSRTRSTLMHNYYAMGTQINRVNVIRDLEVLLDDRLTFHIDNILGLIIRSTVDTSMIFAVLKLYFVALVRPLLEYISIIWSPTSIRGITRLKRAHKLFTRVTIRCITPFSPLPP